MANEKNTDSKKTKSNTSSKKQTNNTKSASSKQKEKITSSVLNEKKEDNASITEEKSQMPNDEVKVESIEPIVQVSKTKEIVKEEKPKSFIEKNKGLLIIGGVAVVGIILFIVIIIALLSIFGSKSKSVESPLVYLTDEGTLKYITSNKKQGVVIAESFDGSVNVEYSNTSTRYILYVRNSNLYLLDTTKNKDAEKIASDVDEFIFSADDKYIVYTNNDDNLYVYNYKDKEKIDTDITSIVKVSNDKVFYKKDGNLYMKSLKSSKDDKVKIVADYKYAYFNEDITKILYSKENDDEYDYYVYNIKSQKEEKVLSDIYTVYDYNDDFTKFIYGQKNDESTFDLSQIVEDDKKESDASFVEHTYTEYLNGEIDYSTWRSSLSEKYDVEDRNKIRKQLEEPYKIDATITVYYKQGNKETELVDNASKVLYADAQTKRIAYTTTTYDTSEKIKLSEVNYFYKIKNYLTERERKTLMFKVGEKEANEVIDSLESSINVYVINNDFYYLLDKDLSYAKINGNKIDKAKVLAENVKIIDSTGDYKDYLVFATDVKDYVGDLKIAKSGKVDVVATDAYTSGLEISESGKIYFYTDYKNNVGDYNVYNGKVNKLFTDVSGVKYINDKYMYVVKDYSSKSSTYDLYRYKGNSKLELIDYSIKNAR